MPQLTLIVVQGGSAVGKSTIATKLSLDLGLYLLSKDYFKEMMYDKLGIPDGRSESRLYGLASSKALYGATETFLAADTSVIIESVFEKGHAEKNIHDIVKDKPVEVIQIYLYASPEIRIKRSHDRVLSGQRHKGHPDKVGSLSVEDFADDTDEYRRLLLENTIDINTDTFTDTDYHNLLESVKIMIGNEEK